jgi:hypothetical protein
MPEIEMPHDVRNMNSKKVVTMVIYKGKQAGKGKSTKAV